MSIEESIDYSLRRVLPKLIAQKMTCRGKGILAADESTPTCSKRFEALGIKSTESTRNEYRSTLLITEEIEN